jgi:hypothetical protein
MDRVIVIEPNKTGAEHLTFNSSVILGFINRISNSVCLAASKSHFEALGRPKVIFYRLPVISIVKRKFISKTLIEIFAITKAFFHARSRGIRKAIVLSVFPPLLMWLVLMARLSGISTTLILHGELEGLVDSSRQRITSFGYWIQRFFKSGGYRHIFCVVLSEGIHNRLISLYPEAEGYIVWANHPIDEPKCTHEILRDIDFATVGVATEKKHSELFKHLANLARSGKRVAHIGMSEPTLFNQYNKEIIFFCAPGEHLGKDEFANALKRVKHAVFPYSNSSYRMTVSGAMLDAIASGCAVLCLPNEFAKDLVCAGLPVSIEDNLEALLHPTAHQASGDICWEKFSADSFCDRLLSFFSHRIQ